MKIISKYFDGEKSDSEIEDLKKNLKKFQQLFEHMQEGFAYHKIICNEQNKPIDYQFIEINPAFEKLTGLKKENVIGKTVKEVLPGIENFWIDRYGKVALTGQSVEFEDYSRELNKYFNIKAYCPEIGTFAVIFKDVTSEFLAIKKIKENEEKFRAVCETAKDAIIMIDNNGNVILWNKAAEEMFNIKAEEILGEDLHKIIAPNRYYENYIKNFTHFKNSGKGNLVGHTRELFGLRDKKEFPIELSLSAVKLKGKWCSVGVIRDVSERKLNEKKLVESIESFKNIFENTTMGIYRADVKGNILMVNKTILKMFGFDSLDEMNERLVNSNFYVNKNKRTAFRKILFERGKIFGFEEEMIKKNGSKIYVRESAALFKNEEGETIYYDGTIEDITDKKINEKITIEARKKAEQSEKTKTEFLRQMSHEIRTLVNVIMNYLQLLRDEEDFANSEDTEVKEAYGAIKYAFKRLVRTVDLILNSSELLTNSYKSNKRDINIYTEILLKVFGEHKKTTKFKNLNLEINKNSIYNFVCCDEYSVYQILDNIVDNAIKYTQEGTILLKTENDANKNLLITITDTGIGISQEYLEVIFDPFTQEKAGSSREFDGTGLGMTLVKGYCKLNNIDIRIESQKNYGTKMLLLFKNTRK